MNSNDMQIDNSRRQYELYGNSEQLTKPNPSCKRKLDFEDITHYSSNIYINSERKEEYDRMLLWEKKVVLQNILEEAKSYDNFFSVELLCQIIEDLEKQLNEKEI